VNAAAVLAAAILLGIGGQTALKSTADDCGYYSGMPPL
jgi:hypothetical protein